MAWSSEGRDPAAAKSAAEGGARLRRAGGERGAQSQPRRHCSRAPNSGGDGVRGAGGGRAGPSPPVRSARGLARPQGTASLGRRERRGSAARSRGGLEGVDCERLQSCSQDPLFERLGETHLQKVRSRLRRTGESEDSGDIRATFQRPSQLPFPHSRGSGRDRRYRSVHLVNSRR